MTRQKTIAKAIRKYLAEDHTLVPGVDGYLGITILAAHVERALVNLETKEAPPARADGA